MDSAAPVVGDSTEHRGVSVLFADLVGSTERVEELGAEGYGEVMRRFHAICNEIVRARGGVVAQYQGDGIICYFGYPRAREDDAIRTIEAALDIQNALAELPKDMEMKTRVGVASGTVMIRSDGDDFGANAVGSAINKAARLEALAATGEILICHDTFGLVGELFHIRDLGEHPLKGFRKAQLVYRVERRRSGVTTRFEALRGRKVGQLVGRVDEMSLLNAHFEAATQSAGCAVVLSAEPGLGKSRLVRAFLQQPEQKKAASFVLQCSLEYRGTPLFPVSQFLEWVAGTGLNDSDELRHNKLKRLFTKVWGADPVELDILLDLLSPKGSENPIDETESVPLRRGRALTLLAEKILTSVAGRQAMIVVFEDVHWIDPSSAMLLEIMVAKSSEYAALVLLSTRPQPPFGDGLESAQALLRLNRLSDEEALVLARQTLGEAELSSEQIEVIIEKSDGVPLFLEEYADMMQRAAGDTDWKIPLTLAGLVQSKLDRLSVPARLLAGVGSALGRDFQPDLAATIAGVPVQDVAQFSQELVGAKLAERSDAKSEGGEGLLFCHALVRDAIYGSMSSERRRALHNDISTAFLSPEIALLVSDDILASHLARAGRHEEAIGRYMQAALAAAGKGAAFEALGHLEAGLKCIDDLPESLERDRMELQICAVRGPTQMVTGGPGNPAFGATQDRAMELVEKLGLHTTMVPVIYNTALHSWATAKLDRAMTIADAIGLINQEDPSDSAYMASNTMRGLIAWHQGRNAQALEALANTVARHDAELHQDLYAVFLKEFGVFSLFYLGLTHAVCGDFDKARDCADRSAALGAKMGFPHAHGFGLLARFNVAMMSGDVEAADVLSAECLAFAQRQGFPEFQAMSQFVQGWVTARRGDVQSGVEQMQAGLAFWAATGFHCWQGHIAAYLAHDLVELGRVDEAEALVDDYLNRLGSTGENQSRAPLLLARAVAHEARGQSDAQDIAQEAWYVAAAQGAKLWQDMITERFSVRTTMI